MTQTRKDKRKCLTLGFRFTNDKIKRTTLKARAKQTNKFKTAKRKIGEQNRQGNAEKNQLRKRKLVMLETEAINEKKCILNVERKRNRNQEYKKVIKKNIDLQN